jgi:hypothetical protein
MHTVAPARTHRIAPTICRLTPRSQNIMTTICRRTLKLTFVTGAVYKPTATVINDGNPDYILPDTPYI